MSNNQRSPYVGTDRRKPSPEEHAERIAVLEAELDILKDVQKTISTELTEIKSILSKYQGTIGGIALCITSVSVLWGFLSDYIRAHWN